MFPVKHLRSEIGCPRVEAFGKRTFVIKHLRLGHGKLLLTTLKTIIPSCDQLYFFKSLKIDDVLSVYYHWLTVQLIYPRFLFGFCVLVTQPRSALAGSDSQTDPNSTRAYERTNRFCGRIVHYRLNTALVMTNFHKLFDRIRAIGRRALEKQSVKLWCWSSAYLRTTTMSCKLDRPLQSTF